MKISCKIIPAYKIIYVYKIAHVCKIVIVQVVNHTCA